LHTGGAPSMERQDPRFDSITKLMSTIFNMCASSFSQAAEGHDRFGVHTSCGRVANITPCINDSGAKRSYSQDLYGVAFMRTSSS
jgi:hypothetical protein